MVGLYSLLATYSYAEGDESTECTSNPVATTLVDLILGNVWSEERGGRKGGREA